MLIKHDGDERIMTTLMRDGDNEVIMIRDGDNEVVMKEDDGSEG